MASQEKNAAPTGRDFAKEAADARSTFASTLIGGDDDPSSVPAVGGKRKGNLYGAVVEVTAQASTENGSPSAMAAKMQLLNEAMLDLGMGWYQWCLVIVTGLGWFLDSFWIASVAVILPAAANEAQFYYSYYRSGDLMISLWAGLAFGTLVWPTMSDRLGRKSAFTSSIVLMGMAGLVGAGMTDFVGLCVVGFIVGFAVGGNQAVDAVLLIESLPASHQWLVAMQGVFWGLGEVVSYAVGWAFIALYTCGTGPDEESTASTAKLISRAGRGSAVSSSGTSSCHYVSNKGWRYTWWCFGCITLFLYLLRFLFSMGETPKSLLARRRDAEAVQSVKDIAAYNKRNTWLSEAMFARADTQASKRTDEHPNRHLSPGAIIRTVGQTIGGVGLVSLLLLWVAQGLTFNLWGQFLPLYLSSDKGVSAVTATSVATPYLYSRYLYVSICAIPGPAVAAFLMEAKVLGRKRTGAVFALLAGLFMFLSTTATSRGASLGWQCAVSFLQYANLAVLYTYTAEVFDSSVRGTGVGLATFSWRFFGMVAWILAVFVKSAQGAVWFSGAFAVVVSLMWLLLPKETVAVAAA